MARQQQEIIRQQEILLQQKEQHIVEQERRLRRLEEDQEQQQLLQQQPVRQTISTSTSVKKPSTLRGGTIDNFLSLKALKYMPKCVKKEPTEVEEEEDGDVVITEVTQKTETVKYIPKAVPGIENLVLVPVPKSKPQLKDLQKWVQYQKIYKIQRGFIATSVNLITSDLMNLHDIRKKIARKRIQNISAKSVEEVFSMRTL